MREPYAVVIVDHNERVLRVQIRDDKDKAFETAVARSIELDPTITVETAMVMLTKYGVCCLAGGTNISVIQTTETE